MSLNDPKAVEIEGSSLRYVCWSVGLGTLALCVAGPALGIYGSDHIQTDADRSLVCVTAVVLAFLAMIFLAKALGLRGPLVSISPSGFRDKRVSTQMIPWMAAKELRLARNDVTVVLAPGFKMENLSGSPSRWLISPWIALTLSFGRYVISSQGLKIGALQLAQTMTSYRTGAIEHMAEEERQGFVEQRDDPTDAILMSLKERQPYLSFALLAVLVTIFVFEMILANADGTAGRYPGDITRGSLVLDGGLSGKLVAAGQIWRFFTAPFLHVNPLHLFGNGIALIFGGYLLERLIGWRWYGAIFSVSALFGGAASFICDPQTLVSAGASGGLVGLFAAAVVIAYHYPSGRLRTAMIYGAVRILVPTLLAFTNHHEGGPVIDYAAHIGGGVGGALMGLLTFGVVAAKPLLKSAAIPTTIAAAFALCTTVAFGYAAIDREAFDALDRSLPKEFNQQVLQSSALIKLYPRDPRVRYARAAALYNDDHDKEAKAILDEILSDRATLRYVPYIEGLTHTLLGQIADDMKTSAPEKP